MKLSIYITIYFRVVISITALKLHSKLDPLCNAVSSVLNKIDGAMQPLSFISFSTKLTSCIKSNSPSFIKTKCPTGVNIIGKSSIILADDPNIIRNINLSCINHHGYHIVILNTPMDISELAVVFWSKKLINVNFLHFNNVRVALQTYFPFNKKSCNDTELVTINEFNDATGAWATNEFFPEKLKNFHRCPIKVTTHKNVVPYIVREEMGNGKSVLRGRVIEIVNAFSQSLNFTAVVDYESSISSWENCIKKVKNHEADIFIGNLFLELPRAKAMDYSVPIFFEYVKFVVPPGRRFSEVEKLFRAFDLSTWICTLLLFLSAFVVVAVLSYRSRPYKVYAFGRGFHNATMNLFAIILGNSQSSLPTHNFPRIILTSFVLVCLIIRTLYQGSLFNFLQSDAEVKEVQSINEMMDKQFTFYMLTLYANYLGSSEHTNVRWLIFFNDIINKKLCLIMNFTLCYRKAIVNLTDFDNILDKISDSNFKGALMHTSSLIIHKNGLKNKTYTNLFCKEYLMTVSIVAFLPKNFYLTEVINEKIGIFHSAGLIEIWDKRSGAKLVEPISEKSEKKPVSVKDLKGIFAIYLIACALSIFCFCVEKTVKIFKKQIAKIFKKKKSLTV